MNTRSTREEYREDEGRRKTVGGEDGETEKKDGEAVGGEQNPYRKQESESALDVALSGEETRQRGRGGDHREG